MKQPTVICFFAPKGLKARAIDTERELAYGPEALALLTVKKWPRRFRQGRTHLFDDLRPGGPLMNALAKVIDSMLEGRPFSSHKVFCHHFRIGEATCLQIFHDKLGLKNSIFAGCRMPYRSARRAKEWYIRSSF